MPRVRKILKNPKKSEPNYFVVDACFLAEKYIPVGSVTDPVAKGRIRECKKWWKEIDRQVNAGRARVYVPDICIAEAFKVLAKKAFLEKTINAQQYKQARDKLSDDVTTSVKELRKATRHIKYHDVPASRDIIIAVDRFYELLMKAKKNVEMPDIIVIATAKYLMDFFDFGRSQIHVITLDKKLWEGTKKVQELPNGYHPAEPKDAFERVFK